MNAIRVAASGETRWFGTVVVVHDEIHAAREVRKFDTFRTSAFASPNGGLGTVFGSRIDISRRPARCQLRRPLGKWKARWRTRFNLDALPATFPRVEMVLAYAGAAGDGVAALVDAGVKGIVTVSASGGGISDGLRAARAAALARGVLFVTAASGVGPVQLVVPGTLAAGDLSALKARILLLLALARQPRSLAERLFLKYVRPEWPQDLDNGRPPVAPVSVMRRED